MTALDRIGKKLAAYLSQPIERDLQVATSKPGDLVATLSTPRRCRDAGNESCWHWEAGIPPRQSVPR